MSKSKEPKLPPIVKDDRAFSTEQIEAAYKAMGQGVNNVVYLSDHRGKKK